MRAMSGVARLVAGAIFALMLASALVPVPRAGAQEDNGLASVTIYKAECPPGYFGPDFFETCYDQPGANYVFTLANPQAGYSEQRTTGENGLTAFEGIATAGRYTLIEQNQPTGYRVFCADEFGNAFPREDTGPYTVALDLTLDDDVRCDWYNIPGEVTPSDTPTPDAALGSLTIRKAFCPVGYEGEDYFGDCYGNPGEDITFDVVRTDGGDARQDTTGADGLVGFAELAGTYDVSEQIPGDFNEFVVYCTANGEPVPFTRNTTDGITIAIVRIDVRCDWYNIGVDQGQPRPTTPAATAPPAAPSTAAPVGTRAPVTVLPNTGAGAGGAGADLALVAALAALAAVGLGGTGLALRRAGGR